MMTDGIGRGKTANVHHASYRNVDIALKQLNCIPVTDCILSDFNREIQILQRLQHRNVIPLIGHHAEWNEEEICSNHLYLALEWMPGGNLYLSPLKYNIAGNGR